MMPGDTDELAWWQRETRCFFLYLERTVHTWAHAILVDKFHSRTSAYINRIRRVSLKNTVCFNTYRSSETVRKLANIRKRRSDVTFEEQETCSSRSQERTSPTFVQKDALFYNHLNLRLHVSSKRFSRFSRIVFRFHSSLSHGRFFYFFFFFFGKCKRSSKDVNVGERDNSGELRCERALMRRKSSSDPSRTVSAGSRATLSQSSSTSWRRSSSARNAGDQRWWHAVWWWCDGWWRWTTTNDNTTQQRHKKKPPSTSSKRRLQSWKILGCHDSPRDLSSLDARPPHCTFTYTRTTL